MSITAFMAFAGGIPTFISIGCFIFVVFFLSSKKGVSPRTIKVMRSASKIAHYNHTQIKILLPTCKPLTKLRFYLLVGKKRYNDYIYQG